MRPRVPTPDFMKGLSVTVKGDVMSVQEKGQPIVAFKLKLDASKTPKTIDFTYEDGQDKGKSELGIYKLENATFTFCVNDIGKERPSAFATKEKTTISLVVLQKAK